MNVEFEIKKQILIDALKYNKEDPAFEMPCDEELIDFYDDISDKEGLIIDASNEFRCSGEDTGLSCQWSLYYKSEQVARRLDSGIFVSWTYWTGGGKHGEPEAMDWLESAYEVECIEEEKMVVVRTFKALESKEDSVVKPSQSA